MNPDTLPSCTANCTISPSRKKEYIPEGSSAGEAGFAVCWAGDAAVADCRASANVDITSDATNAADTRHLRIMFAPVVIHHCTPPRVGERATSRRDHTAAGAAFRYNPSTCSTVEDDAAQYRNRAPARSFSERSCHPGERNLAARRGLQASGAVVRTG